MQYDVAVIGAGPAGSTAARYCAMRGLKTLLLDRRRFPRPKTCGGGVTTAALNAIGFPLPADIVRGHIKNLCSHIGNKTVRISHTRVFMITVDRSEFDNYLVEKAVDAGAQFHQDECVTGLAREGNVFSIRTPNNCYRAASIIGADGVHSATARLTGLKNSRKNCALCLSLDIPAGLDNRQSETIQVYYDLVPRGYGWIFPKGDRISLGVGCFTGNYALLGNALQKVAVIAGINLPGNIKGYYIPCGGQTTKCFSDGVILAGDAAGFVDPFTGEGIRFAVISGTLAGETVWNCFRNGLSLKKENLAGYMKKCHRAFLRDFRCSLLLSRAFFSLPSAMQGLLFHNADNYSRLLHILEGRSTYRKYLKSLLARLPKYCVKKTCQTQG